MSASDTLAYRVIGLDLGAVKDTAVYGEWRDGRWHVLQELDLERPETFAGLKVDAVWVEEGDMIEAILAGDQPQKQAKTGD